MSKLNFRIGQGYDIHTIVKARPLILGGVKISSTYGLIGHSDADCLSHAIADALLGAAGLGDIGCHFPDTELSIANINSQLILRYILEQLKKLAYSINNIDATVVIESPKINSYIPSMKSMLAASLDITANDIGIKATTNEGHDSIGSSCSIASYAVALIYKTV